MADAWIRVYLIRHGHVAYFDANQQPINPKFAPLSSQGIEQIIALSEVLKPIDFKCVYASTMPRSIQTAKILVQHHANIDIFECDEIREIKSGRLRDLVIETAGSELRDAYLFHTHQMSDFLMGENWQAFTTRVITWFEQLLLSNAQNQSILISSHDAVNRIILNWMYERDFADIYTQEQDFGCLNLLDIEIKDNKIYRKRIKLQNFTVYNPLKQAMHNSAMDDVYQMYLNNNGFKE